MLTQFEQLLVNTAIHKLEDCKHSPEDVKKVFKSLHIKCQDTGYDKDIEDKLINHIKSNDYRSLY